MQKGLTWLPVVFIVAAVILGGVVGWAIWNIPQLVDTEEAPAVVITNGNTNATTNTNGTVNTNTASNTNTATNINVATNVTVNTNTTANTNTSSNTNTSTNTTVEEGTYTHVAHGYSTNTLKNGEDQCGPMNCGQYDAINPEFVTIEVGKLLGATSAEEWIRTATSSDANVTLSAGSIDGVSGKTFTVSGGDAPLEVVGASASGTTPTNETLLSLQSKGVVVIRNEKAYVVFYQAQENFPYDLTYYNHILSTFSFTD